MSESGALRRVPIGWGYLLLAGTLAGAAALWLRLGLPTPPCLFHFWTGYPCATCGATRMVAALLHGRPLEAARLNPLLFTLGGLATVHWLRDGWRQLRTGRRSDPYEFLHRERRWLRPLLVGGFLLNWAYLIWDGR